MLRSTKASVCARWGRANATHVVSRSTALDWMGESPSARPAKMNKPLRWPAPVVEAGRDQGSPIVVALSRVPCW